MFKQSLETDKNNLIAVGQTIKLYSGLGWKSLFAKIRFWDAPYLELEALVPKTGKIIDLGCGDGIFANFLALASSGREVYGIEINKSRIKDANRGIKNTKFLHGDITQRDIPYADAVVLVHVLHHLSSFSEQEKMIRKCKSKLKKRGKLIIAEAEPKFSLKFFITWFTDHFLVPWVFESELYSPIFFRKGKGWKILLENLGFSCQVIAVEKRKPFTHIILDCCKI